MPRYHVNTVNVEGNGVRYTIQATDEACALGIVLDEYADELLANAPFYVERAAKHIRPVPLSLVCADSEAEVIAEMADRLGLELEGQ